MKHIMIAQLAFALSVNVQAQDLWQDVEQNDAGPIFEKSVLDKPVPVSVITAEDIAAFGIESIVDAIALLPGVSMGRNEYFDISFGYHELSPVSPRRMLVLIDNTTVLQSGLGSVSWWNLPVSIDDVETIELTRAPDATNYGSNSFNGTLHIKTKRKTERRITSAKYYLDGLDERFTARYQDKFGDSLVAVTASKLQSTGFDHFNDSSENSAISLSYDYSTQDLDLGATFKRSQGTKQGRPNEYDPMPGKVDQSISLFGLSAEYAFNDQHSVEFSLNISEWSQSQQFNLYLPLLVLSDSLREFHNQDSQNALGTYFRQFNPSPDYEFLDLYQALLTDVYTNNYLTDQSYNMTAPLVVNEDRQEYRVAYQFDNRIWQFKLGYSVVQDTIFSPVYLLDYNKHKMTTRQVFSSVSYSVGDSTLSSSFMNESNSLTSDDANNQARLSGLHRISDSASVRGSISYSFRRPSIWEQQGGFRYFIEVEPNDYDIESGIFFTEQVSTGGLKHEQNTYSELGFHYASLFTRTEFDLSLYFSRYEGLIVEETTIEQFNPQNKHFVDLYGVEAELTTKVAGHNFKVFASIADSKVKQGPAVIDQARGYSLENAGFTPQLKLNLLHSHQINDLLSLNSEIGVMHGVSDLNSHFVKIGFSKALKIYGQSQIKTSGFVRYTDQLLIGSPHIRGLIKSSNNLTLGGSVKISF